MATTKITFADKIAVIPPGTRINQVWDLDVNEIKNAINKNADVQIVHAQTIANIVNNGDFNVVTYNEDFTYTSGPQTFAIAIPGVVVKNVFRGRVRLFNDEYTFVDGVVTITYETLESGEKISITN